MIDAARLFRLTMSTLCRTLALSLRQVRGCNIGSKWRKGIAGDLAKRNTDGRTQLNDRVHSSGTVPRRGWKALIGLMADKIKRAALG